MPQVPPAQEYPPQDYPSQEFSQQAFAPPVRDVPPVQDFTAPHGFQQVPPAQDFTAPHGFAPAPPQDFAPPTEFIAPPVVPAPQEPERDETPSGSLRVDKEIRSHRTGSKPAKRADDRTSTQELDRLLGFFDEIRRAKAWDEEPKQDEPEGRRGGRGAKRARR
jgi:hypothetical protein